MNCFNFSDNKKPSSTVCLIVVVLLLFILLCGIFMHIQIDYLLDPLKGNQNLTESQTVLESTYVNFEIIEQGKEYTIFRDAQTDVLYIEYKRNGYSSAMTVLLNADGSPKTYSQYIGG